MCRPPPRSTRTHTLLTYTRLFRYRHLLHRRAAGGRLGVGGLALVVDVVDERAQIGRRRADDADIAIGLFADLARGARRGIGRIALCIGSGGEPRDRDRAEPQGREEKQFTLFHQKIPGLSWISDFASPSRRYTNSWSILTLRLISIGLSGGFKIG